MESKRENIAGGMISKPLRVLHVALTLEIGGLETLIIELSKQLVQNSVHVEILCLLRVDTDYVTELKKDRISVHIMRKKHRMDLFFWKRVASFIREREFDIIHSHSGCFFNAALFRQLAGVEQHIYTEHGKPQTGFKARVEDIIAGLMTDCVISVSYELEKFLRNWLVFNRCHYESIINGVDTEKFKPLTAIAQKNLLKKCKLPFDSFLIGSVGRLEPVKNYAMLLQSFALLNQEFENSIHLLLIGIGSQKRRLVTLAEQLKIKEKVHFLGMQYNVHQILPMLSVFTLSSLSEGTSISLLESQSCGVPAVVTDVGGNNFVIEDGKNGFLCPSGEPEIMAEKLRILINNRKLREEMGMVARKYMEEKFSINEMAKKYIKLYKSGIRQAEFKDNF